VDNGLVPAPLNKATLKRAGGIAGTLLCVLALALLLKRGVALGAELGDRLAQISPFHFAGALVAYVAGATALAFAWALLVRTALGGAVDSKPLVAAHLRSQLAKYLPGNVFHFAYRHASARRQGAGHATLGTALALESLLLIAAAVTLALGVIADPRVDAMLPWVRRLAWASPLLAGIAILVVIPSVHRFGFVDTSIRRTGCTSIGVLAIDVVFFVLAAFALRLLSAQPDVMSFDAWCGWLSLAWVVGYVTPGAPAGLGLREAVLAIGLGPVLGEPEALAMALAYRLLTVAADAVLAGVGFTLRERPDSQQA
jgi:hypothetical protein